MALYESGWDVRFVPASAVDAARSPRLNHRVANIVGPCNAKAKKMGNYREIPSAWGSILVFGGMQSAVLVL